MKLELLPWNPCHQSLFLHSFPPPSFKISRVKQAFRPRIYASLDSAGTQQEPSARERRQLRNERRENKAAYNWREEVEERLMKKPKKRHVTLAEKLNLDTLAKLGPQWWVVRVARVRSQDTAELIARLLARNFPDIEFKVYTPAVQEKKRLKNGTYSIQPKPLFPGCVFLRCVLNKEIHDFIREIEGVGGFVGSKVGNAKRQINKPRPVSVEDMEAIFRQAKEEQEKADQAFMEKQQGVGKQNPEPDLDSNDVSKSVLDSKPKRRTRNASNPIENIAKDAKRLSPGSKVRVVSGTFAEFVGILKKLNRKTRKVTVGFTLFGKETLVDLDVNDIVMETN